MIISPISESEQPTQRHANDNGRQCEQGATNYALDHAGQFTDDIVDHIGQFGTVKSIDAICKLPGDIYKNILLRVAESAQRYDQHNLALLCKVKAKGWVTAGRIKDSLVL